MIKRLIIISVALLGCHLATVQGQTISRKVVSNAGGTLTGGNNQITFNIGETVIPTFSAGSSVLCGYPGSGTNARQPRLVPGNR